MDNNSTFLMLFVSKSYQYIKTKQEVQLPEQRLPEKYLTPCRTNFFKVMFCLFLAGFLDDCFSIKGWFVSLLFFFFHSSSSKYTVISDFTALIKYFPVHDQFYFGLV